MSFRLKTILGITILQAIFFVSLIVIILNFVESSLNREIRERAQSTINLFSTTTREALLSSDLATLESVINEVLENPDIAYVRIFDANMNPMNASKQNNIRDYTFHEDHTLESSLKDGIFDILKQIKISGTVVGTIQLGLSTEKPLNEIQQIRNYAIAVAGIEIFLMTIMSYFFGSWLTQRLILLKNAAQSIENGELGHQLEFSGNDEITHTISAFNSMSSKLQHTEQQQQLTMEKLELADEQSRLLLTSATEGIFGIDTELNIRFANPSATREFGFEDSNILTQLNLNNLFKANPVELESIQNCIQNGEAIKVSDTTFPSLENTLSVDYTCSPIKKNQGVTGAVIIFSNINKRKEAEEAIRQAQKNALESAQIKADFLSTMSHELLTPMNGVIGLLQLIDKSTLSDNYAEYIKNAQKSADKQLKLINHILDYSHLDSKDFQLKHIDFNLELIVNECIQENRQFAEDKNLTLNLNYNCNINWLIGDPDQLKKIINNLIDNAIKFTQHGQVDVIIQVLSKNNEKLNLQFIIKDTGIGIAQHDINKLFTSFQQLDSSSTRVYGGIGLGLSICHLLIKHMGGEIHVSSQLNQGTVLTFNNEFSISKINTSICQNNKESNQPNSN